MNFPEQFRHMGYPGDNGIFMLPRQGKKGKFFTAIATNGMQWEHVSITISTENRCPTWEEMCYIKSVFWDDEETVMQLHPPKSQWVNNHPYCLHLWKPLKVEIPLPDPKLVGLAKNNLNINKT
jgi:hypothetical protein